MTVVVLFTPLHLFTLILLSPLHPFTSYFLHNCTHLFSQSLHRVQTLSQQYWYISLWLAQVDIISHIIGASFGGLSGSKWSVTLLVHLFIISSCRHRQPHYWYILSWLARVDIVSHIIGTSCHCLSSSRPSAQQYLSTLFFRVRLVTQSLELARRLLAYINRCFRRSIPGTSEGSQRYQEYSTVPWTPQTNSFGTRVSALPCENVRRSRQDARPLYVRHKIGARCALELCSAPTLPSES